ISFYSAAFHLALHSFPTLRSSDLSYPDLARFTVASEIAPGEQVHIVKFIGYGWSSERSRPALIDQVVGALAAAQLTGWDGLLAETRRAHVCAPVTSGSRMPSSA